jgi:hypothetical protein
MKPETERKIQHILNEALNNSLKELKIKVNEELTYDIGLEYDYNELKEKFLGHLELIKNVVKTNKNTEKATQKDI